jgi:expansin (peptidoglycan-binding protein)
MLSNDAWRLLNVGSVDRTSIDWDIVSCQHKEPLAVHFAEGANTWWISLQIVNANWPILDVWIREAQKDRANDDGSWLEMEGKHYNYFTTTKQMSKVDVRVRCSNQRVIWMRNIVPESNVTVQADQNC